MRERSAATAWTMYETGAGYGVLAASEQGLVAHHLPYGTASAAGALELAATLYPLAKGESDLTAKGAALLRRYFAGERVAFELPLDLDGCTPFQKTVYRVVAAIPYGAVLSYREVAGACGSPNGARAIGGAMARNLLPVIIPCHRVVGASGVMTGFTAPGGTESKRGLLSMEGVGFDARGGVIRAKIG
ncbi:methylated-DNA--[protein]-cysteine S-methyltransferase [Geomonas subterranea]|uniref:Methylated-DNA--[protein]-cysteine S-methyltransferase n=1 Tax=Geomonas subterranea TaxID=2847989 RepID=A0ABX8LAU2_9BACT|nr:MULTISPECIES: methylated-DNA--[protein]-cysteine S-methyltransferase [Geomonas]QXE89105.1 methylated-DNA--[protein]-cysteine S-methyltransferase [Geomonas subterranea]QXM08778.1 methylated-DNA--[protein]-cysteine S-methyltransferase [Geomonas subterranea]